MKLQNKMVGNGFKEIYNKKGCIVRINEDNGKMYIENPINLLNHGFGAQQQHDLIGSTITVADVEYMLFKGSKVNQWFIDVYKQWRSDFATNNIDQYNKLINMQLTI